MNIRQLQDLAKKMSSEFEEVLLHRISEENQTESSSLHLGDC